MFNNKVSVVVCLYNTNPELFDKCIDGLVNQIYRNFEVIVVDDGSDKYKEEHQSILNKYNDPRIKYFRKEHSGKSQTLNYAFQLVNSEYIVINDSDDVSFPDRLAYQVKWMDTHKEYDCLSNAMIRESDNTIFPCPLDKAFEITEKNVYYCVNHPCYIFRKSSLLKVPFLFCQMYDATEDNVMNHIMFYYGVKMWYDPKILLKYADHPNQVHWANTNGFLKEVIYKLTYNTFNAYHAPAQTTCLLVLTSKWTIQDVEKTVLNIRLTSNNVRIMLCDFANELNLEPMEKYTVDIIQNINSKGLQKVLQYAVSLIETENIMFINTPIRFYEHNWDLYLERETEKNHFYIYEPYLFDMEKIDEDNFRNENGKGERQNILYGERLTMMSEELTEEQTEYDIRTHSEYVYISSIPVISKVNVFMMRKDFFVEVIKETPFEYCSFENMFNIFFSIIAQCKFGGYIFKKLDWTCSYVNMNDKKDISYYLEYFMFTKLFLNETQFIHQKIINDVLVKKFKSAPIEIANNEQDLQYDKPNLTNFLKNINAKQSWIL